MSPTADDDAGAPESPEDVLARAANPDRALRRSLRDIERRLEVAYATCVTAERALLAQNCEYDHDIALCLRWGVGTPISDQQRRLRAIASSIPPDLADGTTAAGGSSDIGAAAPGAHSSPADGTTASSTPAAGTSTTDTRGGDSEDPPALEGL